jgi:hypothetical protein
MNVEVLAVMIPIIVSLGAFVMVVYLRRYEKEERLKMIEHGMDPHVDRQKRRGGGLKFALVAVGVGLGLVVGNIFDAAGILDEDVAYFSMSFLFGGLGLLGGYLIETKQIKEEQEKERELQKRSGD